MKRENSWLVEGYVLLSISPATQTNEEMPALDAEFLAYLAQAKGDHVHFIYDMSAQTRTPDLRAMTGMEFTRHSKLGWSILVGNLSPVVKFMISMVAKITGGRFRIMDSREEAIDFLMAIDQSIPRDEEAPNS